jgi:hypothetical protein
METNDFLEEKFLQLKFSSKCYEIAMIYINAMMNDDESILEAIEASCNSTEGILIATELRLIYAGVSFIDKSIIRKVRYLDITSLDFIQGQEPCGDLVIEHREKIIITIDVRDAERVILKVKGILLEGDQYSNKKAKRS